MEDDDDNFDHKMLYELHTIHEWKHDSKKPPPSTVSLAHTYVKTSYEWLNLSRCHRFYNHTANPAVSHDGEYVALLKPLLIEIKDKRHFFDTLAEVQLEPERQDECRSHLFWSQNSYHFAYCNSEHDLFIYDIEGKLINQFQNLGLEIIDVILFEENGGFNLLALSDGGKKLSLFQYLESTQVRAHVFNVEQEVLQILRLTDSNVLVTTHLDATCYTVKEWELELDPENPCLNALNSVQHHHGISRLPKLVLDYPDIFSRIEKSKQKYLAVLDNSTKKLFIRHIPSLSLAKSIAFTQIKDLAPSEVVMDVGWWSEDIVALLSASGKFILIPFKTMDMFEAETFEVPSMFLESPVNSIFVVEQSRQVTPKMLDSLRQLVTWSREPKEVPVSVNYKLYQLLQTSPTILFYQKIESGEFGEAILLANRFELDKDEVYKAQWKLNNAHSSSVHDFLYKVTDENWVTAEIEGFIPTSADFAMLLLDHGLNLAAKHTTNEECPNTTKTHWEEKELFLLNCKTNLLIYNDILYGEPDLEFDGELFKRMCGQSLVRTGIHFATQGVWTALDVLMTKARNVVEEYWLLLLSYLPETLDPLLYADILPEFISPANLRCEVDTDRCIGDWFELEDAGVEVGLWDEEVLEGVEGDLTLLLSMRAPTDLEIPPNYLSTIGPLTTQSIYTWYTQRCDEIISQSCLFSHASSLLKRGVERNVPLQIHQCVLRLIEDTVCCLGHENVSFGDILNSPLAPLLLFTLQHSEVEDHVDHIVDTYLPFVRDIAAGDVTCLVLDHIKGVSESSLVPLLQALQYKSGEFVLLPPDKRVTFTTDCFKACIVTQGWTSTANEIVKTVNSSVLQYKLNFGLQLAHHIGPHSPATIFECFEDTTKCGKVLEGLFRATFTNKDIEVVSLVAEMVDKKVLELDTCFQIMFEQCLEVGDLDVLEQLSDYRVGYLDDTQWSKILETYAPRYLESAIDIDDAYIGIVRYLLNTDKDNTLSEIRNKVEILEDLKALGVLIRPTQLDGDKVELVRYTIKFSPINYLQEEKLVELSHKLGVDKSWVYAISAGIAYNNSNYGYCKRICKKAINFGYESIVPTCVKFLRNREYNDLKFKELLFYFIIKHVPTDQIDEMLEIYHQLPTYIEDRKRKLSDTDLGADQLTNMKILKIASQTDIMDIEGTIDDVDNLQELYYWLLGRSFSLTNTNLNKVQYLNNVIHKAIEKNPPEMKAITGKISDILQANILKETGENVNVPRFTYDRVYRSDTIMNLAGRPSIDLAVSLGHKYGLELWDIHFRHYRWLLLNDQPCPDKILQVLLQKKDVFISQCELVVYPELDGRRYSILAKYYSHLKAAGAVGVGTHITAVNKIRAAIPGLDYKELTTSDNPLSILEPLLSDGNVHVIGKMAQNIGLTKSQIFRCYCNRFFWEDEGRTHHTYEERWTKIKQMLQYLEDDDKKAFSVNICCSFNDRITHKLRILISKDFPDLHKHIKAFGAEMFDKYKSSYAYQAYLAFYRHPDILDDLLLSMIFDKEVSCDVGEMLQILNSSQSPEEVIDTCVAFINTVSAGEECTRVYQEMIPELYWFHEVDTSELIDKLLLNMSTVSFTSQSVVINKLKALCSDVDVNINVINTVINVLEKHLTTENDAEVIVFYKTNSLVSEHWKFNIQITNILTNELISKLCKQSDNLEQCQALGEILKHWASISLKSEWIVEVLETLAGLPLDATSVSPLITSIIQHQDILTESEVQSCSTNFSSSSLPFILILSSSHTDLYNDILPDMTVRDLDNPHLVDLLIERDLFTAIVNTALYPVVIDKITETKPLAFVKEVARKLYESGSVLESVSLLAQFTRSNYSTFSVYRNLFASRNE